MRTLSTTLLTNQKSMNPQPRSRIVLTQGVNTYTYYGDRLTRSVDNRIRKIDHDEDGAWSQRATITLANDDRVLNALSLYGYKAVIGKGAYDAVAGEEYSDKAPLWVTDQREDSLDTGELIVRLTMEGTPNLLARDKALSNFLPSASDAKTVKTYISHVMGATIPFTAWVANHAYVVNDYVKKVASNGYAYKCTIAGTSHAATEPVWTTTIGETQPVDGTVTWECVGADNPFVGCTAYTVDYDSEDSLIDTLTPKDSFRIYEGQSRLSVLRKLLDWTGCVGIFKADGHLHISVPNTSATAIDVGSAATNRASTYNPANTILDLANVANGTGYLTSVEVWAAVDITGLVVASYTLVAGTTYTCRDSVRIGNVTAGSKQTFSNLALRVGTSDVIGCWYDTGNIERSVSGGSGLLYYSGQATTPGSTTDFSSAAPIVDDAISLYGAGFDYDYCHSLVAGQHNFFDKAYRKALVMPNKIIVHSQADDAVYYSGNYTDATSFALLPMTQSYAMRLTSDAQGTAIATAIIGKLQQGAQQGSASAPINVGAEIYDYVLVTDSRAQDYRAGNIGWLHERVDYTKKNGVWLMTFGFGKPQIGQTIDQMLSDLETYTDVGQLLERLAVKDLYVENIHADSMTLVTIDDIADGNATTGYQRTKSTAIDANGMVILDQVTTGTYGLVLSSIITAGKIKLQESSFDVTLGKGLLDTTEISGGKINLTSAAIFAAGYDPSSKRRNFTTTPTTPYDIGDLWHDATTVKRCTTARATGAYVAGDWTAVTQDEITDGSNYSRVDVADLSSHHLKLTTSTVWSGKVQVLSGVTIDSAAGINIFGVNNGLTTRATEAGAVQCYVGTDGYIYAGAGAIWLSATELGFTGAVIKGYTGATLVGTMSTSAAGFFLIAASGYELVLSTTNTAILLDASGGLKLPTMTSDPGTLVDRMIWYRSDTDEFRIRVNGVTRKIVHEAV